MKRASKTVVAGAGLLLGMWACSSSPQPIDTSQVDGFINSLAQASCAWEFKCCTDAELKSRDGSKFTDQAHCVPYSALALQDQMYVEKLAVREGRLRVDATKAAACLAQKSAMACNLAPGMTPPAPATGVDPCTLVFVGNTPVGSECLDVNECVAGAHCVADQLAQGRGVCVPYQQPTQICNSSADCNPSVTGLYCAGKDFTCHTLGKLGDACAYTTDVSGMNPTLPMLLECDGSAGSNLYCDPASKKCATLPGAGQPCLSPPPPGVVSACDPNPALQLVCARSTTGTGGTCRAPGKAGDDCSTVPCGTGLFCQSSGTTQTCATLPGLGQDCLTSGERCATPYFCNPAKNYVCDQPAPLGGDCTQVTCDTGLWCDRTQVPNACKAQLADGATCTQSAQCLSLDCGGGFPETCQPRLTGPQCTGR